MTGPTPGDVVIVVGAHPSAERHDRPVAYALQRRIGAWFRDNAGESGGLGGGKAERALVCTDLWYLNDPSLRERPTISIGGYGVNALSAYLADKLPGAFVVDDVLMVQLDVRMEDLTACCWGADAGATVAAVDAFAEKYLDAFLSTLLARA